MTFWHKCLLFSVSIGMMADAVQAAAPVKVVASGIGLSITESELNKTCRIFVLTQASSGVDVPAGLESVYRKRLLDDLIMNKLMALRANPTDKWQASQKATENFKAQREQYTSAVAFELKVEATGLTMVEFKRQLETEALALIVAKRELRPTTAATEGDILKFYNDHNKQWLVPETAKVAHVLLLKSDGATGRRLNPDERAAKQAAAAKVLGKATAGVDFKQLAKEFSEDLSTKETGGELVLARGTSLPEVEKMVFTMQPNQVVLVESEVGYHVIKVVERKAAKVRKLNEVSNDIRNHLQSQKFFKQLPGYFGRLKKQAGVRVTLK
jgi:parvulin-like peptidyl-prolyl isomerase